ncbi:MAG TPA: hypothetical protein VEV81_08955 [Pyrinomonadaceae bacterium]|jgi:hypothetical protein|nr:hypothetical protein [Pyrinomonadaceae bacterium]
MFADDRSGQDKVTGDVDPVRGQPIEEAEKNLSRHSTKDSSPPVEEQWRTSVPEANDLSKGEKP